MIALLFKDGDAARKIFERWRERFGNVDREDEIFVAIARKISVAKPAHYRVLITSRLPRDSDVRKDENETFMFTTRTQTMQAESDTNLGHFLHVYKQASTFLLAPAILSDKGEPEILMELAILKRGLSVKMASEIRDTDLEAAALSPRD